MIHHHVKMAVIALMTSILTHVGVNLGMRVITARPVRQLFGYNVYILLFLKYVFVGDCMLVFRELLSSATMPSTTTGKRNIPSLFSYMCNVEGVYGSQMEGFLHEQYDWNRLASTLLLV